MTIDEFSIWLQDHPQEWRKAVDTHPAFVDAPLVLVPKVYQEFIERFGPIVMLTHAAFYWKFLGIYEIAEETKSIAIPEVIPFMSTGDGCHLCLYHGKVIFHDPSDFPDLSSGVADTFEECLGLLTGTDFWVSR